MAHTDERLQAAVRQQLAKRGYANMTIEGVAAAAGAAKTTIYRRWPSKAEMVFDLLIHRTDQAPPIDTGSAVGDLTALAERAARLVAHEPGRSIIPGLLAEMTSDPALRDRIFEAFITPAREEIAVIVDRHQITSITAADLHAAVLGIAFGQVHVAIETDPHVLTDRLTSQLLRLTQL